jgi:hypothetical protein
MDYCVLALKRLRQNSLVTNVTVKKMNAERLHLPTVPERLVVEDSNLVAGRSAKVRN